MRILQSQHVPQVPAQPPENGRGTEISLKTRYRIRTATRRVVPNPAFQDKGAFVSPPPNIKPPLRAARWGGYAGWTHANCLSVLQNNDFLRNTVHRHEPPVTAQPIQILVEDDEVVVVDKPSSLPVHPCGRFRHNTVIFILGKEHDLKELHTIHRLDRMTSGVLMFAKTAEVSKRIDEQVRERQVRAKGCSSCWSLLHGIFLKQGRSKVSRIFGLNKHKFPKQLVVILLFLLY